MTKTKTGIVYDASAVLSMFDIELPTDRAPKTTQGEIVIYYGGWSLQGLRDSPIGKRLMHQLDWYKKFEWNMERFHAGFYRLRIPIPDSYDKYVEEQEQMFRTGDFMSPVVLAATALLVHFSETGQDLLMGNQIRCKEAVDFGRAGLAWCEGRLSVRNQPSDMKAANIGASSVRAVC